MLLKNRELKSVTMESKLPRLLVQPIDEFPIVALFRKLVAGLADVGGHPEQFLQNDKSRRRRGHRTCDIGGERAVLSIYGDVILHCVLLRRPLSSGPPPMSSAYSRSVTVQPNRTPSSHAKSFMRD